MKESNSLICEASRARTQMGSGASSSNQSPSAAGMALSGQELAKRNNEIELQIAKDRISAKKTLKILLLGGPESGKSTIFKQMKIIHLNGFTKTDLINYRYLIYSNVLQSLNQLLDACRTLRITLDSRSHADIEKFRNYQETTSPVDLDLTPELASIINRIWSSDPLQDAYRRRNEFVLLDSAKYYLDEAKRLGTKEYKPTDQDVLRARIPTTGIHEMDFPYRDITLRLVDVGGQKSEQRKWIHCFDDVNGVLFIVALSCYDQLMNDETGDAGENRLINSMRLFQHIGNSAHFGKKTAIILFLNKIDQFTDKIAHSSLKSCFSEYGGPNTLDDTCAFIEAQFQAVIEGAGQPGAKTIYTHFTNATDTQNVDRVFDSCMDVVFKNSMEKVGFM